MKKSALYLSVFFMSIFLTMSSCQKEQTVETITLENKIFSENMSIFDLRVRSINDMKYVREVVIKSFSDDKFNKESIVFKGNPYGDDGKNNDLVAGDGVFTSPEQFNFNLDVKYDEKQLIKSVVNTPIIDPLFKKHTELQNDISKYKYFNNFESSKSRTALGGGISCKVKFGTTGCRAQQWGWCGSCCVEVDWSDCEISFNW